MHPFSPTSALPVLATLHAYSAARVEETIQALRYVYFSHVPQMTMSLMPAIRLSLIKIVPTLRPKRMACFNRYDAIPDSGYASAEEGEQDDETKEIIDEEKTEKEDEALAMLRSNERERDHAIKWLIGLVIKADAWIYGTPSPEEQEARTKRLEDASRPLTRFAGDDESEESLRTFLLLFRVPPCRQCGRPEILSVAPPIMVELNDAPVNGSDHTAVGLQSWGSAIIFAERMWLDPERYLGVLHPCASIPTTMTSIRPRRVIVLGAGTGLLCITAAQIFSCASVRIEIKATDYHPDVLENLPRNVRHNPDAVGLSVEKLDLCVVRGTEDKGAYDVVLAADVVYRREHASWIRGCVDRTLSRAGVFWLIVPKRSRRFGGDGQGGVSYRG